MRFLFLISALFLASCSAENNHNDTTTDVSIAFGQTAATGALGAAGSIPNSVNSVSLVALDSKGKIIAGPLVANRPNFTLRLKVPNGNNIRFRILAFSANNATGTLLYETLSKPVNLKGAPISVAVTMSLSITLQAAPSQIKRNEITNLSAKVSGSSPTSTTPVVWDNNSRGTLLVTDTYGATARWTAPDQPGKYIINAQLQPGINPDQDPNTEGAIEITVLNQDPYVTAFTTGLSTPAGSTLITPSFAVIVDPDASDTLKASLGANAPSWASIASSGKNPLVLELKLAPKASVTPADYTFTLHITDGSGGGLSANITVTVTPEITADNTSPVITLLGANPYTFPAAAGLTFTDPGATVTDNVDATRTITATPLDAFNFTEIPGAYALTYVATDAAGNPATPVDRSIFVTQAMQGVVKDANGIGISGASIAITDSGASPTVFTQADGTFTAQVVPPVFSMDVSKLGFNSTTVTNPIGLTQNNTVATAVVLSPTSAQTGSLTGVVKDAYSGLDISGVTIEVRAGINAAPTDTLVASLTTGVVSPIYTFTTLPAGTYTITATKTGFLTSSITATVTALATSTANPVLMSPIITAEQTRIVLSWSSAADLDAHLVTPTSPNTLGSQQFHVNLGARGSAIADPYATLDFDVTTGFGPETITVSKNLDGTYRYYVRAQTPTELIPSSAVVQVFQGTASSPIATFNVPVLGVGDLWHVFDMDVLSGFQIINGINTITSSANEIAKVATSPTTQMALPIAGNPTPLNAIASNIDLSTVPSIPGVAFSSFNTAVASVDVNTGLVTPNSLGTANIIVSEPTYGYSSNVEVTVYDPTVVSGPNSLVTPPSVATNVGTIINIFATPRNLGNTNLGAGLQANITAQLINGTGTVSTTVIDQLDGSYKLTFNTDFITPSSGTVAVFYNGVQLGSPVTITW